MFGGPVLQFRGGLPTFEFHPVTGPFVVKGVRVTPIPLIHKNVSSFGYRTGNFADLTDCNRIPDASHALLRGVELLVIDASNRTRSDVHFSFRTAIDEIEKIRPKKAWFTHTGHSCSHVEVEKAIEEELAQRPEIAGIEVHAGFDGLVIQGIRVEAAPP
jgi:phosphoribosyl 1,2-cyclic phosphate phosphodiesterase